MSKERALQAINGKFSDRMPIWDYPDSPALGEKILKRNVWDDPYQACIDMYKHYDIDIVNNISGSQFEWNFPLVRVNGEAEIIDSPECEPYKKAFKPVPNKPYRSLYDITGMKSRAGYWGYGPTLAICKYAVNSPEEVLKFNPLEHDTFTLSERIDFFRKLYKERQNTVGDSALYMGWYYCTLFMWFVELFGYENFMVASMMDPDRFKQITLQFLELTKRDITAMCHVDDMPLIGCHDDICDARGPMFEPDWFRENIFPHYGEIFKIIHDAGKKVFFCTDGHMMPLLNDIRKFDIDGLAIDHNNDLKTILEAFSGRIVFGGFLDPSIAAIGSFSEIEAAVKANINLAKHEPGYFFSSGSVNGHVSNDKAEFYYECFHKYSRR
jgi:hypothetical protein